MSHHSGISTLPQRQVAARSSGLSLTCSSWFLFDFLVYIVLNRWRDSYTGHRFFERYSLFKRKRSSVLFFCLVLLKVPPNINTHKEGTQLQSLCVFYQIGTSTTTSFFLPGSLHNTLAFVSCCNQHVLRRNPL